MIVINAVKKNDRNNTSKFMIIIREQYSKWFAVCWDLCQGQNINMQNQKYNNIKKIRTKTIQEGTIPSGLHCAGICARARKLSSRPTEWPRPKVKSTGRQGKIPETNTRKYPLVAEENKKYKKRANAGSKAMY